MFANLDLGLTPMQRGMVFHELIDPRSGINIEQVVVTLEEAVDATCLETAWRAVIDQHPVLRSRVVESGSGEYRLVTVPGYQPKLVTIDAGGPGNGIAFDEWLAADRTRGFDLFAEVPLRLTLFRQPGMAVRCVWSFHHVLLDMPSFADVLVDAWDAYDRLAQGQGAQIPARPDHSAFIDWLREMDPAQSIAYWQGLLDGIDQITPFPAIGEASAARTRVVERCLGDGETASIRQWMQIHAVSIEALIQAAWATLLARYTDQASVVFGATHAGRSGHVAGVERMLGVLVNTVPVRADVGRATGIELVRQLCAQQLAAQSHGHLPLAQAQSAARVSADSALFHTLVACELDGLDARVHRARPDWVRRHFALHERAPYPVVLHACANPSLSLRLAYVEEVFAPDQAVRLLEHLQAIVLGIVTAHGREVRQLPMLTMTELGRIEGEWNATRREVAATTIQVAFAQAVAAHPRRTALVGGGRALSYAELDAASTAVAATLVARGVVHGAVVGLSIDRSPELVIAMLGILKAGGAYLPLDPTYPDERLEFCVRDSGVRVVLAQRRNAGMFELAGAEAIPVESIDLADGGTFKSKAGTADDLAYVIYTSGSTGRPKGVLVTHGNVVNFFVGMDEVIDPSGDAIEKRWLAVTSVSFDISVLELLWTLTRGYEVVMHGARELAPDPSRAQGPSFSLFHFASGMDGSDPKPYRLILEAAKFADEHGFEAVWSPERHFHDFGAPYPNPSVMNAALATITNRVQLRAGSVVLPLHDPLRVAEEWGLVDQLSHGRVGISFASGWQPNDFVLAPGNYERRKDLMFEQIEAVRALWRGERIKATNPKGDDVQLGTYPRPVQAELPVWITAAGSPDTFRQAGTIGANILTHMLGQSMTDLEANIGAYRAARAAAGHDPATGRVTVMVHAFVGEDTDQVREVVRGPMKRYLQSAASLVGSYADAWAAFKRGAGSPVSAVALSELRPEDQQELYDFAFERYFETSGLLGSVDKCAQMVVALHAIGVDEIACLIDFGVDADTVIAHLPHISRLKEVIGNREWTDAGDVVSDIARHAITHMQCTPSLASTIPMLAKRPDALESLRHLLIGGEALPRDLVSELHNRLPEKAVIINMYGPTETTIWSTTERVERDTHRVTIGRPIANTQCYVLDSHRQLVPPGCVGELHVGGAGVTRGYHERTVLNADRFFELNVAGRRQRVYATGDLVRQLDDGRIECLGRNDFQVKVRGHRIELGEIEVALRAEPGVEDAVVVARTLAAGTPVLVGYLVPTPGGGAIEVDVLKSALRQHLPEYMVPNVFAWLDALPLTPNGKVDRNALPMPMPAESANADDVAAGPRSDVERTIREVWQRVLNVQDIGVRDNFFELGGHSVLAFKVQSELSHAFGFRLPIVELFRSPTIEALAGHFERNSESARNVAADSGADRIERRGVAMSLRTTIAGGRSHDGQRA